MKKQMDDQSALLQASMAQHTKTLQESYDKAVKEAGAAPVLPPPAPTALEVTVQKIAASLIEKGQGTTCPDMAGWFTGCKTIHDLSRAIDWLSKAQLQELHEAYTGTPTDYREARNNKTWFETKIISLARTGL